MFLCFLLSEGFRDLIQKAESGERAVKALPLLLQHLTAIWLSFSSVVNFVAKPERIARARDKKEKAGGNVFSQSNFLI